MKIFSDKNKANELKTLDEWFKYCPPAKKEKQWVDKRSAKEMAKFWLNPDKQNEFFRFIKKVDNLIEFDYACPEYATKFDKYSSPRKNDLCIFSKLNNNPILITIEGKADEPFGNDYFYDQFKLSIDRKRIKKSSKSLNRTIELYDRFLRKGEVLNLRYQLLYWIAGTIEEAKRLKSDTVFLIVQEFVSDITDENKLLRNKLDLNNMIKFLSVNQYSEVPDGEIVGPFENKFTDGIKLHIGKYSEILE